MYSRTLALVAICCLAVGLTQSVILAPISKPATRPATAVAAIAPNDFALQVKSIQRAFPKKQIRNLLQAYLLNDAEFQALIREVNKAPAYRVRQQLLNQPQVRQLRQWVAQQLLLSGGSSEIFDDLEISLFNKYPHWAQSVNGVRGFQQEFVELYPLELLRSLLESSAQQSVVFGEFWRRVVALKPVYERIWATPQAKAVIAQLRRLGVDVDGVDRLVRYQLGWSNATLIANTVDYDYYGY